MNQTNTSWASSTRDRFREVENGLLSLATWAKTANINQDDTELLLAPYREMMETIYERDMPLSRLVDNSDLLLHVSGPSASGPSPRVSVLASLLTITRDEVTRLAKSLGSVTTLRVPSSLDMTFAGVASGSLFVGFTADSTGEGDLTLEAIKTIADVSCLVSENPTAQQIALRVEDPATRDAALAAVRHLSPSGRRGISGIDLLGRKVLRQTSLTTDTRRVARGLMAQRVSESSPVSFVGTVREVDLDASRFDIRNVDGYSENIRCAHELGEDEVKAIVDKRVRVTGTPEYGARKTVRLLWVAEVESLSE
jgi:hypothetical protein